MRPLTTESRIRILAGTFVLVGVGCAVAFSPWFLLLPAFVGVNLIQSAFTGFCPAEKFVGGGGSCCGGKQDCCNGGK